LDDGRSDEAAVEGVGKSCVDGRACGDEITGGRQGKERRRGGET